MDIPQDFAFQPPARPGASEARAFESAVLQHLRSLSKGFYWGLVFKARITNGINALCLVAFKELQNMETTSYLDSNPEIPEIGCPFASFIVGQQSEYFRGF